MKKNPIFKVILSILLTLAVLGAMVVAVVPVAADSTYITVIAGGNSVPILASTFTGLTHYTYTVEYTGKSTSDNLSANAAAGDTTLQVASIYGLKVGETVAISDAAHSENVTISAISAYNATPLTITLTAGLVNSYTAPVSGTGKISSPNSFHTYSGVPVYTLMSYVDSGLTATNYDVKDTSADATPYISLVGPTSDPANNYGQNLTIEGNNTLIVADANESGPLAAGILACSSWTVGGPFNKNLKSLELVYTVAVTTGSNGTGVHPCG